MSGPQPLPGGVPPGTRAKRLVATAFYLVLARHLPWSPRPGGWLAKRCRGLCARWMLDACGNHPNIEHGAWFGSGKGVELGHRSDIGMDSLVMGPVTIGNDVMMAPRCVLIAQSHMTDDVEVPMNQQGFKAERRINIEDDVWLGTGVTVLPGRRIGRGSVVAAGSVVVQDVPPFSIVGGNPAAVVKTRR